MQLNDSVRLMFVSNMVSKFSRCPNDSDAICSEVCPLSSFKEKAVANFNVNFDYKGNLDYALSIANSGYNSDFNSIDDSGVKSSKVMHGLCETLFKSGYFNEVKYKESKHKVAVVGSGPAGLSAAILLGKWGIDVDVYESKKLLGGLSRNSLPTSNMHEKIIDKEIRLKSPSNVNYLTEQRIMDIRTLKEKYSAVIVAAGVYSDKDLMVYFEDGNFNKIKDDSADQFINDKNLQSMKDKTVAIIGYGNLGLSLAIKLKKLGAKNVYLVFPKDFKNVPTWDKQIIKDFNIGIKFFMFESDNYIMDSLDIKSNKIIKLNLNRIGSTSYYGFNPDYNDVYELDADEILFVNPPKISGEFCKENTTICDETKGLISINHDNYMTSIEGIFAAGDAVLGGSSVPRSALSGKTAAINVYKYLEKL
jgi:NADPH-dependent glutamate synthase beta subunit-like oxidoreductase